MLRGGAGLFAVAPAMSRGQWRAHVATLRLQVIYPGIQGFVYAPLRAGDLMRGVLGFERAGLAFEVYAAAPAEATLLYARGSMEGVVARRQGGARDGFARTLGFDVAGSHWSLHVHAPASFVTPAEEWLPSVVGGAGIAIDLFLFAIIASTGRQSRRVAASEEAHRLLFERLPLAVRVFAPDRRTLRVNAAW